MNLSPAPMRRALAQESADALLRVLRERVAGHYLLRKCVGIALRHIDLPVERLLAKGQRVRARLADARG